MPNLLGGARETELLRLLHVGGCVGEALKRQLSKGRHVLGVAGHEEEFGRALGPGVKAGVQAELHPLVVAARPVAAAARGGETFLGPLAVSVAE